MDQLLLDRCPDDPRHLVAVELDDRIGDLELRQGAKDLRVKRRTELPGREAGGVLMTRPDRCCKPASALRKGVGRRRRGRFIGASTPSLGQAWPAPGPD